LKSSIFSTLSRRQVAHLVHEAPKTLGVGAEIAALILERVVEYLMRPVIRVTGYDVPIPPARSVSYDIPSEARVMKGIEKE
jgi:pyruvate/2-oxoglutarate/acetoin dehydrogenase E1 component